MISLEGSWEGIPNLLKGVSESDTPEKIRETVFSNILHSVEECFDFRNPNSAKGWIVEKWKFSCTDNGWKVSWVDEKNPSKVFHVHTSWMRPFWDHLIYLCEHEMNEWLTINERKPFYPHSHERFTDLKKKERRGRKRKYFFVQ